MVLVFSRSEPKITIFELQLLGSIDRDSESESEIIRDMLSSDRDDTSVDERSFFIDCDIRHT